MKYLLRCRRVDCELQLEWMKPLTEVEAKSHPSDPVRFDFEGNILDPNARTHSSVFPISGRHKRTRIAHLP
jgi:hypothetical protein